MASVKDLENVANNLNNNIISVENNLNNNIVGVVDNLQRQLNKNKKEIDMLKNKLETVESDHENLLGNETDTYFIAVYKHGDGDVDKTKILIIGNYYAFIQSNIFLFSTIDKKYILSIKANNDNENYYFGLEQVLDKNKPEYAYLKEIKNDQVIFTTTSVKKDFYVTMDDDSNIYLTTNQKDPNIELTKSDVITSLPDNYNSFYISIGSSNKNSQSVAVKIKNDNTGKDYCAFNKFYLTQDQKLTYILIVEAAYAVNVKFNAANKRYTFILTDDSVNLLEVQQTSDNIIFKTSDNKELYVTMDDNLEVYLTDDDTDSNLKKYTSSLEIVQKCY